MSAADEDLRWLAKVSPGEPDECWEWQGKLDRFGYGRFRTHRTPDGIPRSTTAHRAALYRAGFDIPSGFEACHHCDNARCVNVSHLYVGTHRQNIQDTIDRGRRRDAFGTAHFRAVIPFETVQVILERHASGESQESLAKEFGVDQTTISGWKLGKTRRVA